MLGIFFEEVSVRKVVVVGITSGLRSSPKTNIGTVKLNATTWLGLSFNCSSDPVCDSWAQVSTDRNCASLTVRMSYILSIRCTLEYTRTMSSTLKSFRAHIQREVCSILHSDPHTETAVLTLAEIFRATVNKLDHNYRFMTTGCCQSAHCLAVFACTSDTLSLHLCLTCSSSFFL